MQKLNPLRNAHMRVHTTAHQMQYMTQHREVQIIS